MLTINSIQSDTRSMTPEDAARTYYLRMEQTGNVEAMIAQCMNLLKLEHDCNDDTAMRIAHQAYADMRCNNIREHLDIDASTSTLIFIRTPEGSVCFTVRDIMNCMERYKSEQPTIH